MAQEAGKPIKAARTEVERAIFTFNVAAEEEPGFTANICRSTGRSSPRGGGALCAAFPWDRLPESPPLTFP